MSMPAYQPVLHSQMSYMPGYHAKSYLAGGLMPTFDLLPNFFLRTGFYAMLRDNRNLPGRQMQYISDLSFIYHTPIGPGEPLAHQIRPEELEQPLPGPSTSATRSSHPPGVLLIPPPEARQTEREENRISLPLLFKDKKKRRRTRYDASSRQAKKLFN